MERLLKRNNSKDIEFISDSFDKSERHMKTNIFIAVLGIDVNVVDNIIENNNENVNYCRNSSRAAYRCGSLSICKLLY